MDSDSIIQYSVLLLFLIIGGAWFAGAEISLASVNRLRIKGYADDGDKRARRVMYIINNFDKALTTVLICNNVMLIGCASIATLLTTNLFGEQYVGYSTIITTVVVFLLCEMIPKCFGKDCSERVALSTAPLLYWVIKIMTPITFLFTQLSKLISKIFANKQTEPTVTEEELYDIIETIVEEGALEEEKGELVQSALEFSERTVKDILTPWQNVVKVTPETDNAEILDIVLRNRHSRLPVVDSGDNAVGILHVRRFLKEYLKGPSKPKLYRIMSPVHFVKDDIPIDDLLPDMSRNKTHLLVVSDSQGATLGIVTVEDILEELVGEIYDEEDAVHGTIAEVLQ